MKNLFILCSILVSLNLLSQGNNNLGIEIQGRGGIIIAHRELMSHIPESFPMGAEVSIYYQTNGKSAYHKLFNYPKYGISLLGTTVGNERILGNLFGAFIFGDFPIAKDKDDELAGNIGFGLGYLTRIYDPIKNPKNVAISSHVNALINLGLKYRHYFKNNLNVVLGFNLTHASNGASRMPNLGINLAYASFGFGYQFKNVELKTKERVLTLDKKWKYTLLGIFSVKEDYPIGGKLYPVGGLSFVVSKRFNNKSGIEIYADGFYKRSLLNNPNNIGMTNWNIIQAGVFGGYNLYINKVRIVVGLGVYVFDKYKPNGLFYSRLGFKYQINKHLVALLGIKSHWAKADYFEYGLGYTF